MHPGEVAIDVPLVLSLVAAQFPRLAAGRSVRPLAETGTVNAVFRLGDDLCVRLPRLARYAADLEKEIAWLPSLARELPLAVPAPQARGAPGGGYPLAWAIYRWIEGEAYGSARVADEAAAAVALAGFVRALQAVDTSGAPPSGRAPLRDLDAATREAIASLPETDGGGAIRAAWDLCLAAPPHRGKPVWRHCDLLPPNLVVADERLCAVVDFGSAGVGDPALDVVPAWSVFGRRGRTAFRRALGVDDSTWARARGYALHQALLIIPYYAETNPAFAAMARHTVRRVLADLFPTHEVRRPRTART